ncbi:protein lava lamp-like [Teleopsis dalmanni]|uniref:protein lava lamp-like n=2 Tax=Teleopsis dalmanni TaxID=139649 RepID=UPI0018CE4BC4|nr:protein lava lamp-like [Teleopsis dalmanni]XP_037938742.1 protein lava lamp-like [Teleopsis dalmanni]XP_037938743.1 protein lava lamp-like [Teleopsis dalmanni]
MSSEESTGQSSNISNIQEKFSKQQEKIAALKDLVKKSEVAHGKSTSTAKEKVKNIAQRLTDLRSKSKFRKSVDSPSQHEATNEPVTTISNIHPDTFAPQATNYSTPNPTPSKIQDVATPLSSNTSIPNSEKILLLRQQMEHNKARMAQRASSKLHLEQLVTQLKEKFDSTQQSLEDTAELGRSMNDLSAVIYTPVSRERHKSATDLSSQPFNLEKERIKFLENRCRLLEKQLEKESQTAQSAPKRIKELENKVLELTETLNQVPTKQIDILEKEIETISNELSEKSNEIEKLKQLQGNDNEYSNEYRAENDRLNDEKMMLAKQVAELENANLELQQKLSRQMARGDELKQKSIEEDSFEEKLSLIKRIGELEQINDVLETTRCDLTIKCNGTEEALQSCQKKLNDAIEESHKLQKRLEEMEQNITDLSTDTLCIKESATAETDAKIKDEMAHQIQELQTEIMKYKNENRELKETISKNNKIEVSDGSIAEKILSLEATIESQRQDLADRSENLRRYEEELMEKTIELNVLNANFKVLEEKLQANLKAKPLFSATVTGADNTELQNENQQLKQKLDESNKAMIKLKLKLKQTEKQMEKLKKASDLHAEVIRLEKCNEDLQQKITELEDEKGQWQLSQVEENKFKNIYNENIQNVDQKSVEEKQKILEETIRMLEEQKFDLFEKCESLSTELHLLQQEVSTKNSEESARVKSEMSEIHMEEQLEEQIQLVKSLEQKIDDKNTEIDNLHKQIDKLQDLKQEADKKLEHYISENIELLDKIEKLSKSSSSAESIEIVERLTQQERAEIDEYNNQINQDRVAEHERSSVNEITQTEMGPELTESLIQLREESAELIKKIELFTNERREVLDKMEILSSENQELHSKIKELVIEKELLESNAQQAEHSKSKLEVHLNEVTKEKELLAAQIAESNAQNRELTQGLTSLQKSSEVMAAIDSTENATLFDKCEKSLSKLNSEIEAYRKANDKNAKFNVSKKLAKEAKNAYTQLSELLQKVKEASTAVETVTVVETVVAVTAPNGKALAEYEQLTAQNRELKATVNELREELQELKDNAETATDNIQAIGEEAANKNHKQLLESSEKLEKTEAELIELQSIVEDLRIQLQEARLASEEKTEEVARINIELTSLRNLSEDFDQLINNKEMTFEKQIEQLTRLRKELEAKCETYEGEMEILQTLVKEQKQQIIEAFKENEHEVNLKLLELQQRDEQITHLKAEIALLKEVSNEVKVQFSEDLEKECQKLRESLKINKALVAEQVDELANKQETIDTLNQQIIDLYKTMEENTNKIIEKEDEVTYIQELLDTNNKEIERLCKDNDEQKSVVDKLLMEIHSHKLNEQQLPKLERDNHRLQALITELEHVKLELEQKNKEQLEKLKKYAANLKKRTTQCQELEAKLKEMEKGALDMYVKERQTDTSAEQNQIQELNAKNMVQSTKIKELEETVRHAEEKTNEFRDALQLKTVEILETMERNANLENELEETKINLNQKLQETIQLQNALAASQEQMSDWGNEDSFLSVNEGVTKELAEKSKYILMLEDDLRTARRDLLLNTEKMSIGHDKVNELEKQLSTALQYKIELSEKLADKLKAIDEAERVFNDVQNQLFQSKEHEYSLQQAKQELSSQVKNQEQQIENLTRKLNQFNDKENVASLEQIAVQEQRMNELSEELKTKSLKFEKSKAIIKERNNQIHRLHAQLKDLQDKLSAQPEEEIVQAPLQQTVTDAEIKVLKQVPKDEFDLLQQAYDKLKLDYNTEKANFLQIRTRLETVHDGIQAKLQEDMSYIETLEQENSKFKDKICKLEECVASFEERRASMERRANLLDAQMQSRADEYEKTEDELIYRLNMLSEHDEVIGQRLIDSQEEKEELQERMDRFQAEFKELNIKHTKLENEFEAYRQQIAETLENENVSLRDQLVKSNSEMQRLRSVYDAKLAAKATEIDEIECELSEQLEKINIDKRKTYEDLEKSRDECMALKDEIVRLKETLNAIEQSKQELERESTWLRMQSESAQQDQYELQELRMQAMQDKTEIDELRHQIDTLASNHEMELQALRIQICELDSLRMQVGQNQTDDQVFIESENKRLTDLLAEKSAIIENYQRQNLQLQMAAVGSTPQVQADPFALAFGLPTQHNITSIPSQMDDRERERISNELLEKTEANTRLQRDLQALQNEYHTLLDTNADLQRQVLENSRELENLRAPNSRSPSTQFRNDVIPAPPMFFASEQITSSPFDELVQVRTENMLEGAIGGDQINNDTEQPTIEDLQRNVSDLEKHAQDLENKLATRNQLDNEYEQRLKETQVLLHEAENHVLDREQQLQQAHAHISKLEQEIRTYDESKMESTTHLTALQSKIKELQDLLETREKQFSEMELKLQSNMESACNDASKAADHLRDLESNIKHLEVQLSERDEEILKLKNDVNKEEQLKKTIESLESQIITVSPTESTVKVDCLEDVNKPTLDMFFGGPGATEFEKLVMSQVSDEPIVEELIVPKTAYVCQPKETAIPTIPIPEDLGDDWGDSWANNEATAEAAHFLAKTDTSPHNVTSLVSHEQRLEIQLQDATEQIQHLKLVLESSEQQKQELQAKSNKLIKKLKEYKIKMDEVQQSQTANVFRKSTSVDSNSMFNDLDAAIQEELRNQITKLESRLEEQHKVLEGNAIEKDKLLKRIDVLTAGTDRMSEMKERQDMDLQMYQIRIRELQEQLNKLEEWGDDTAKADKPLESKIPSGVEIIDNPNVSSIDFEAVKLEMKQKIEKLTVEIEDITGDKMEVAALLEEEKLNVVRAEETIRLLQQQLSTLENANVGKEVLQISQYNDLKLLHQDVQKKYNSLVEDNSKLKEELVQINDQHRNLSSTLLQKENIIHGLSNKIENLEQTIKQSDADKNNLETRLTDLNKQLEELTVEKQLLSNQILELQKENIALQLAGNNGSSTEFNNNDELTVQLQEKDSEILHLRQRIEDLMREDQTEKLVLEILTKNQEIQLLKTQVKQLEEERIEMENNLSLQITQGMQASKHNEEEVKMREEILMLRSKIETVEEEKCNMEEELKVLNNHVMMSLEQEDKTKAALLEMDLKEIEIKELRKTIAAITKAESEVSAGNAKSNEVDFIALNAQWEAVVEQRCSEIAQMWREHMEKREEEFRIIEVRLQEEIAELQDTQSVSKLPKQQSLSTETTASDSTSVSASSSAAPSKEGTPLRNRIISDESVTVNGNIIEKMQTALESQEMEIVTLKEQLAIRSAEYARLAAQYDPFKLQTTLSHSGMSTITNTPTADSTIARRGVSDASLVPKSELDFALYMLHQRDVRCDEMTLEVVSLLEERDTLQLKLSNTLRQLEEIKAQTSATDANTTQMDSTALLSSESPVKFAVTSPIVTDSVNNLNQKLSELQTVSHSKDKVIKEDRDQRIRQMERIQQDLAKIPPAAVSELVGTDLSQSSQSPSSVLLNWLWGNNPNNNAGATSN